MFLFYILRCNHNLIIEIIKEKMNVIPFESGSNKRPVKKARRTRRVLSMPLRVRNYINTRGTPDGVYEIVRSVSGKFDIAATGITIGLANYEAGTFTFSPTNLRLVSGVSGNTASWSVPNSAELAGLWDKVMIDKVEMEFFCPWPNQNAAGNGAYLPLMLFASDDNDTAASLTSVQQMDCEAWQPGSNVSKFKITVRPRYQGLVYYTSLLSSYEPKRGYVVSDTDIPHYGLKMAVNAISGLQAVNIQFNCKYYFKYKELK